MKELIKKVLSETIQNGVVTCDKCGWEWKLSDGGKDKYICHKCGHDNTPHKSNFEKLIEIYKKNFPIELKNKVEKLSSFVKNYITKNGYNLKFLNSCSTGFSGVRTRDQIIICSPNNIQTIGDLIYTIFHEIRHEQQIKEIKMDNPLTDYELDDFEKIYEQYWEMELDADQFAKNMIAKLIQHLEIPLDVAKKQFSLSEYIREYPSMSNMIRGYLKKIIDEIKDLKKSGEVYSDIQDHPIVKRHLSKLESLI